MTWLPMDTAPIDGTVVLLWLSKKIDREYPSAGLCDYLCLGLHQYGRWVSLEVKDCGSMGGEWTGWMADWCHLDVHPAYWQPITPPPLALQREAAEKLGPLHRERAKAMTPTPDDATDWSLIGPLYRGRIIELEARIAELEAERDNLLLYAQMACTKCQHNVHLKKLEMKRLGP